MAEAGDAPFVAERLGKGLAKGDAAIFGGVVAINMQIADGLEGDIDEAVAAELAQHMIKEADAGGDVILTGAVEIEAGADLRLAGRPVDGCLAHGSPMVYGGVYSGCPVENKAQPAFRLQIAAHLLRLAPTLGFKAAAHRTGLSGVLLLLLGRALRGDGLAVMLLRLFILKAARHF